MLHAKNGTHCCQLECSHSIANNCKRHQRICMQICLRVLCELDPTQPVWAGRQFCWTVGALHWVTFPCGGVALVAGLSLVPALERRGIKGGGARTPNSYPVSNGMSSTFTFCTFFQAPNESLENTDRAPDPFLSCFDRNKMRQFHGIRSRRIVLTLRGQINEILMGNPD